MSSVNFKNLSFIILFIGILSFAFILIHVKETTDKNSIYTKIAEGFQER